MPNRMEKIITGYIRFEAGANGSFKTSANAHPLNHEIGLE